LHDTTYSKKYGKNITKKNGHTAICKLTINNESNINAIAYFFSPFSKNFSIKYIVNTMNENVTNCALAAKYGCIKYIAINVIIADIGAFFEILFDVKYIAKLKIHVNTIVDIYIPNIPPTWYIPYIDISYNQCGNVYGNSCHENGSSFKFPIPFWVIYSPTFIV